MTSGLGCSAVLLQAALHGSCLPVATVVLQQARHYIRPIRLQPTNAHQQQQQIRCQPCSKFQAAPHAVLQAGAPHPQLLQQQQQQGSASPGLCCRCPCIAPLVTGSLAAVGASCRQQQQQQQQQQQNQMHSWTTAWSWQQQWRDMHIQAPTSAAGMGTYSSSSSSSSSSSTPPIGMQHGLRQSSSKRCQSHKGAAFSFVAARRLLHSSAATAAAASSGPDHDDAAPAPAAGSGGEPGESRSRRRKGTTESRAALRRTTESRAAIEDVSVMNKSQLMRRNKPWLVEQCWQRKLAHDGLKDDLVQRLLAWQATEQGQAAATEAAASAQAAMEAARAAVASATAAAVQPAANSLGLGLDSSSSSGSRRRRKNTASSAAVVSSINESEKGFVEAAAVADPAPVSPVQPPRNAAAAAADTLEVLLQQLQEQPGNAAVVAVARNALELYVRNLQSTRPTIGSAAAATSSTAQLVAELCDKVSQSSSPQSLAAIAKACYSREVQNPVLAAAMAAAVAAVARQLGPQEVYGVLRLLVEHFDDADGQGSAQEGIGLSTMQQGFKVLAEAMIGCSQALEPMQLAEAVQLLGKHKYDDPYGLWMIAKEAARRLQEFRPADVVMLLDAVAGMCVADDALCEDVAVVVGASKGVYTQQQLEAVAAALCRMGHTGGL